jgi:transcriptional regulator with GAF, ATPase, and Fis domain
VKDENIQSFAGQPLVFQGETFGVLAVFSREVLTGDDLAILGGFAQHAAAAIANARAFDNIQELQEKLELENDYLREEIGEVHCCGTIVGQSSALQTTLKQIELVAPTDSTVLITGESGTGKELIARAIHQHGDREDRPLVRVNCGSIPRELFESEFFGHVKGAFTGALSDRVGRFQLADGGTLFLDEVGEIPLELQSKLLRVLQEGEFERLGEDHTRQVDVRIIAATNRDLKNEVTEKRFRQDLYYRLSVFPVQVSPLRERKEDIGPLADHLMHVICTRLGRPELKIKQRHILELQQHDWPGNVRELQNVIERAVITSHDGQLHFELPDTDGNRSFGLNERISSQDETILTTDQLKQLEKENIRKALKKTGYKIHGRGGSAELLEIRPTTLASKIKSMGIDMHD